VRGFGDGEENGVIIDMKTPKVPKVMIPYNFEGGDALAFRLVGGYKQVSMDVSMEDKSLADQALKHGFINVHPTKGKTKK